MRLSIRLNLFNEQKESGQTEDAGVLLLAEEAGVPLPFSLDTKIDDISLYVMAVALLLVEDIFEKVNPLQKKSDKVDQD
jgi:hypothetical protein